MANPYCQVALTYVRRWRSSYMNSLMLFAVVLMVMASVYANASTKRPPPVFFLMFAYFAINLFLGLSLHVRQQFADSRSRLMPGFCRVHITVATVVMALFVIVLPVAITCVVGLHSAGLVAVSLSLFAAVFWVALLASLWLSVMIGLILAAGCFAMFTEPVCSAVVAFAEGGCEPLAIALLFASTAAIAVGMRRMVRLNEDSPFFRGWTAGWEDRCRCLASEKSARDELASRGFRERCEERRVEKLLEHTRQAPLSPWSGVCRWQVMLPFGRTTWLFWVVAAGLLLLLWTWMLRQPWITRDHAHVTQAVMPAMLVFLIIFPIAALMGQFMQRKGQVGRELLLPIDRGLYLRQVGLAAALCQIQAWSAVCVATFLWWLIAAPEAISTNAIATTLAIGTLCQVWLFAGAIWAVRHRNVVMALGLLAAVALGGLAPTVMNGFTNAPNLAEWQQAAWIVAGLLTSIAALAIWIAYRRWLIADVI